MVTNSKKLIYFCCICFRLLKNSCILVVQNRHFVALRNTRGLCQLWQISPVRWTHSLSTFTAITVKGSSPLWRFCHIVGSPAIDRDGKASTSLHYYRACSVESGTHNLSRIIAGQCLQVVLYHDLWALCLFVYCAVYIPMKFPIYAWRSCLYVGHSISYKRTEMYVRITIHFLRIILTIYTQHSPILVFPKLKRTADPFWDLGLISVSPPPVIPESVYW